MKILIAGASGLVGSALIPFFKELGWQVQVLTHSENATANAIKWDPASNTLNEKLLEGYDAMINLSGENIADERWSEEKKRRIRESRVKSTHLLSETLKKLEIPPKVFVNASAIGYYGSRGSEEITEESVVGNGFLADVCKDWEDALDPAVKKKIRVVHLRIGVVLSSKGGALAKMLIPFKMGLGGVIGSGDQYISWLALDDLLDIVHYVITHENIQGPINAVSPVPLTNREFTKILGDVLKRPTFFPLPAFFARLIFGEMADEMLLSSVRAQPKILLTEGFVFRYADLKAAFIHLLDK